MLDLENQAQPGARRAQLPPVAGERLAGHRGVGVPACPLQD